ncbi:MAG TPA: glutamate racemase [Candidatus Marinimicrobia bacterium]|nr:glutamate racemase [Candidatus Neomarinimicrobiota bacterium]
MADLRPIGVFDSGLGGLTVVKALRNILPNESIVYFGDTARVPYGNKSQELIQEYSREITHFLIKNDAKLIVVACNTASALALNELQSNTSIPVIGVIDPGADEAVKATNNNNIGIIGTVATISSKAYEIALIRINKDIQAISHACPLLVPLAEEGWLGGDVVNAIVKHYISPLNDKKIDTLILGCTHYPLLKDVISKQVSNGTVLIDSAAAVARAIKVKLLEINQLNNCNELGTLSCFVTDIPMRFELVGQRFLGAPMDHVQTVHEI